MHSPGPGRTREVERIFGEAAKVSPKCLSEHDEEGNHVREFHWSDGGENHLDVAFWSSGRLVVSCDLSEATPAEPAEAES